MRASVAELHPARRTEPRPFRLGYHRALDGLRGVCILLVVVLHTYRSAYFGDVTTGWGRAAAIGVDGFFVLSGFLITSILLEEWERSRALNLKKFYARRALRLLPALFAVLVATVAYSWIVGPPAYGRRTTQDSLIALFYSSNWAQIIDVQRPGVFGHTWSLSIEEQFYLLWPITLLWLLRRASSRESLCCWVSFGVFLSAALRVVLIIAGAEWRRVYYGTDTRADSLLLGTVVAVLFCYAMVPEARWFRGLLKGLAFGSVAALAYVCFRDPFSRDFDFCVVLFGISLCAALIIMQIVLVPNGVLHWVLSLPPLVYLGKISYGLYVWHFPVFLAIQGARWSKPKELVVASLVTAGATLASFYLLERPCLRLKTKFSAVVSVKD
jgi:peptidoglycan/LPS O-acetylase OafA/YrhL